MGIRAHYLEIEWETAGVPSRVEVSTYPIKIETGPDGNLYAEVSIFRNPAPWVGLQFSGKLADVEPFTIGAQNEHIAWLRVSDKHDGIWWIPATGWSKSSNQHISEMHRSFGSFSVELGPNCKLIIDAIALELDRAHVQEYLDDFRDELVWLAVGKPNGAMGHVGSDYSRELVNALREFTAAAGRVLDNPALEIREVTASMPSSKLRPNSETFRAVIRRPGARAYPGRVAQESADVPDNRYIHGMVEHCRRLAQTLASSAVRHQSHLAARAAREEVRAQDLRAITRIEVDKEIFDNQVANLRQSMDAISAWEGSPLPSGSSELKYEFSVGKQYHSTHHGAKEFFYNVSNRDTSYDRREGIEFSVAQLPATLHELTMAGHAIDKTLTLSITGKANITSFMSRNRRKGRRAVFTHISHVQLTSPLLARREAERSRYEHNGWHRLMSGTERKEYDREASIAIGRAEWFNEHAKDITVMSMETDAISRALSCQHTDWCRLKVASSTAFPMGMRFVQNPIYAALLAAFHKVTAMELSTGLGGDTLDKLGSINTLHASALYERWCLIKIIAVLIDDFDFVPQENWMERVVTSVAEAGISSNMEFSISFARSLSNMTAHLDVQPVLANGRRPDFCLRFNLSPAATSPDKGNELLRGYSRSANQKRSPEQSGLVMDAKFRTRWGQGKLTEMLAELVDIKDYGQNGHRVFILQPAKSAIAHKTSPLVWGRDCDYGQDHPTKHAHGSIQLAADPASGTASMINLRRLIALELQKIFPEPMLNVSRKSREREDGALSESRADIDHLSASFCINCGESHKMSDIKRTMTQAGNPKWFYKCSQCKSTTMRTHCYECKETLYKNGFQMTYHLTVADQISNVVCPYCGAGF
ncbi:hypothetical protein NKW53_06850 [Acetobacter orientalis]|uniref:hypothetical protein n=1 Tax=Acetobacter orientalis TaxID=146474 RepID=UPI00209DAB54|nr:hypothetical protein [Acetobacter orientalis]MCP1215784.1 hypothetical protein [Acetobacter orientalis]MCP1217363.1 hypothetical protein [Acetobacter orientalis]